MLDTIDKEIFQNKQTNLNTIFQILLKAYGVKIDTEKFKKIITDKIVNGEIFLIKKDKILIKSDFADFKTELFTKQIQEITNYSNFCKSFNFNNLHFHEMLLLKHSIELKTPMTMQLLYSILVNGNNLNFEVSGNIFCNNLNLTVFKNPSDNFSTQLEKIKFQAKKLGENKTKEILNHDFGFDKFKSSQLAKEYINER
ncbi:hypothetical protein [Spiroplasma alleghenense]|uniref:Uncharacterized protein n=1 Tax=Spiroplasma alleghenense TaxID=216931 RepID=A0A345Z4U1_9MOLU|nr:hypothetical protein [Spiroplasma alleghenense]AXK51620.1 hypothetical protein SALLE_v1c09500 [Spiroplasma alleghenense]